MPQSIQPNKHISHLVLMDKARKYAPITDNLNRLLQKSLSQFSNNTQWIDINNWLQTVEQIILQNPSPYISQKIVLSKRLQQGLNPALPVKVHECVIRIHQLIFSNMRTAVEGNVNQYIRLFAEDLGVYSVALFPFFGNTSTMSLRMYCLGLFNDYYMDLRRELIPLLPGMLMSLLSVLGLISDDDLKAKIFDTLERLLKATGRRYFIGAVWMSILKHPRCRSSGLHILKEFVLPMKMLADEESLESSHGFSDIEDDLLAEAGSAAIARKRAASQEKSRKEIERRSNSVPRNRESQTLKVQVDEEEEMTPLVRKPSVEDVMRVEPPAAGTSKTVASLLGVPQQSNLIFKPMSPKMPRGTPIHLPSESQLSLVPLNNITPNHTEDHLSTTPQPSPLSLSENKILPNNSGHKLPPPPFGFSPSIKPPLNFQMSSIPQGFQLPHHMPGIPPNFTLPINFIPPKLPGVPALTPPPVTTLSLVTSPTPKQNTTDLEKELFEEMGEETHHQEEIHHQEETPNNNSSPPVAKEASVEDDKKAETPIKGIDLSPPMRTMVTPPPRPEASNFSKPPEGFKPPANFTPPPGFKFPPPNQPNNQMNPSFKSQEKIDFSKIPPPTAGMKFDPKMAPPPGFKMPPPGFVMPPKGQMPPPQQGGKTPPPNIQKANPNPAVMVPPPIPHPTQSSTKPNLNFNSKPAIPQAQPPKPKESQSKVQPPRQMKKSQSTSLSVPRKAVPSLDKVPYVPTPQLQQLSRLNDQNIDDNNYPNRSSLVLNAIVSCLFDENSLVKRHMLDFMCSHLRVKNQIFPSADKKVIVEAVLQLFVKKELTITKRVNNWLFGKPDQEQNKYFLTEKNELIVPFIIQGFQNMLSREPKEASACTQPLKILQNFYMQHEHLVSKTLPPIVLPTIRYIFNFGYHKDYSAEIMKAGQRFFQNIPSFYDVILQSLGDELLQGIERDDDLRCFEVAKYLDFAYIRLMRHELGHEELEYISNLLHNMSRTLDFLSELQDDLTKYSFIKSLMLLIVNLVDRKDKIDHEMGLKLFKERQLDLEESHNFEVPKERLEYENELKVQERDRQLQFKEISFSLEKFYSKLGQIIRMAENLQPYEESYKLASLAMIKVQRSLPKEEVKVLPSWFEAIEIGIKLTNPVISLSAIEAMIFCLTSETIHPAYNSFKRLIVAQKNKKVGSDYQKQALEKLWSLLDFPHMHRKIIDLIVNFSKYFPYEFTEVVAKSFQTYNVPDKEASIQRFSHFWRLTGHKYKDLLENNHELSELNKVGLFVMLDFLEDDNPLVRHAAKNWLLESMGLFSRVLEPLFSELMQIRDNVFITPQGQNIISKKYDTKKMFGIFRRIKSILTNGASTFLSYIYQTPLSQNLEELKNAFTDIRFPVITKDKKERVEVVVAPETKEPVLPRAVREEEEKVDEGMSIDRLTYMDLLILISVKYIKGQAIQSMGIDFHVGNSSVNAAAIEFLETFLGYIDDPKLCERFLNFILQDLFKVLEQGVGNREYIIQVQLLNLFKTIFFNSSFRLKGDVDSIRRMFSNIYTNPTFSGSLLKGLDTPFSYVRTQFISFISISVPLIADFLDPDQCTNVVKSILYTYYQIIKGVNMRLIRDQQPEICRTEEPPANFKRIMDLREKNMKENKVVKLTDNLTEVAKTNEILAILHGVSVILNYFFELDKLDFKKIAFQFTDPYTMVDTLKTIISLGFASSEKEQKLISKPIFLHNLETCESILRDIGPVFETILRAWPLSEEYVKIATSEFTEIGMRSFGFERFSKYNGVLKSLIDYVSTEKESIWGKIISIMKPMFFKFPKEIVSIYIELWVRECPSMDSQGQCEVSSARCEFLMKIIETLIVNDFPLNILVAAFVESPIVERVKLYQMGRAKDARKGNVLEYEMAALESKLVFFIHVIFHYLHLTNEVLQRDNLLTHWRLILKALKPFLQSKNPNTCLWILEFVNLCAKKYSPKEILSYERFKSQLHLMINDKLKFVASVGSKTMNFFYEEPLVDMKLEANSPEANKSYRVILPYPPSIYELLQEYRDPKRFRVMGDVSWELFTPVRPGNNEAIERRNRFFAFKTLKRIGLELIQNTYMPEKNHWIVTRTKQWIDEILPVIEDKSPENMVFAEAASEVLHDLLDKARSMFLRILKPDLIKIFNKDDFFICNVPTLKYWSKIIDWVVNFDKNSDTFTYYLDKVALSTSYFSSGDSEAKKRVKSFERICFIIYSGCKDRYSAKIKGLLEKISEILKKSDSAQPALLILILFVIRILILRLSEITLNQLFIDIWPMIMTLLIQLFSRKMVKVELANEISKHPNLLLAALKLIEMASVVNLAEFSHHQWIFLYDYFGVKMSVQEGNYEMNEFLNANPEYREIFSHDRTTSPSPFIFKPSLTNYFPPYSVDYTPRSYPHQLSITPLKRQLIVKEAQVQQEGELRIRAIVLCQYLINLNQLRIQVDDEDIEMLLVNDFISLDNFIHKM